MKNNNNLCTDRLLHIFRISTKSHEKLNTIHTSVAEPGWAANYCQEAVNSVQVLSSEND